MMIGDGLILTCGRTLGWVVSLLTLDIFDFMNCLTIVCYL